MPESFVQFAFSAGVLSEAFLARPDLEKFDLGLRGGENWLIDYRGGATTRPPLEFVDFGKFEDSRLRLHPFQFNTALANTYMLVFGHEYIRFLQNGAYILETPVSVATVGVGASVTVITDVAHGFSTGDAVKFQSAQPLLQNITFTITVTSPTAFTLTAPDGEPFSTSDAIIATDLTVARVYTIASPYQAEDLLSLVFDQFRDEINIVSNNYAPRKLRRLGDTNWTLTETSFAGNEVNPTDLTLTASATGTFALAYGVTTVNNEGQESHLGLVKIAENVVNFSTTAGSMKIEWPAVAGINEYRIYRTIFTPTADMSYTQPFGLLGQSFGPQFIDNNIIPDFARVPHIPDNPFADGAVLSITMTAPGSGYSKDTASVSISGGSGFVGKPIVNDSGEIIAVRIFKNGAGYTGGTLTFSGGTGATATFETSPASGNWPSCTARIQQRRVYGGTLNFPMNIFASVPGKEEDFSFSSVGTVTDAYDLSLDSEQLTPIKYIVPASIGFFAFTEFTIFQVRGTDDSIITAQTAVAEPKSNTGCGDVAPLKVGEAVVFVEQGSTGVSSLRPSNLPNFFQEQDNSIYSSHYFSPENPIESWTYADSPDKVVWAQRRDGSLLSMTFVPEQNVYAWSDHSTDGEIESVATVRENNFDRVYLVSRREREGKILRYIERFALNVVHNEDQMWALDCAYLTSLNPQTGTVRPSAATGAGVTFTASSAMFTSDHVGAHIRCGNGRAVITEVLSDTQVLANIQLPITELSQQTKRPKAYSNWSLDPVVSTVEGLWGLEGATVEVLADGGTEAPKVVVNGTITLESPASFVAVGLPYSGDLITLPLKTESNIVLDKKQRPVDVSLRVLNARGLSAAALGSNRFYDFKERRFEDYGVPTRRLSGIQEIAIGADWTEDNGFIIRKDKPLRATVLGFVHNTEIGLD